MSPGPTTMEPTALVLYYVDHQTGICKGGTRESTPYYITEMFIDYWECCKSSFEEELCLKEGPTRDPTGRPTEEAAPSSQPSEALSTLPSSQPTEPHPTGSPTKYHWGALRVRSWTLRLGLRPAFHLCLSSSTPFAALGPEHRLFRPSRPSGQRSEIALTRSGMLTQNLRRKVVPTTTLTRP